MVFISSFRRNHWVISLSIWLLVFLARGEAFQHLPPGRQLLLEQPGKELNHLKRLSSSPPPPTTTTTSTLFSQKDDNDSDLSSKGRKNILQRLCSSRAIQSSLARLKPTKRALRLLLAASSLSVMFLLKDPIVVHAASAPVMALPKAEGRDPATEAIMEHERQMTKAAQQELQDMAQQARQIEKAQGEKARIQFERQFKENQQLRADEKKRGLVELQRNLLEQGICPFQDLEGQRQVVFYERGVDLGDVSGTPFNLEKEFERRNYKRSMASKKQYNRQVIACMVTDLVNRDVDPVEYFLGHQDKTARILDMPAVQAAALAEQYKANLEQYGQITVPKEGETSALQRMQQAASTPAAKKAAKAKQQEEAKRIKAEQKSKAAQEKLQLQEEKKAAAAEAAQQAKQAKATKAAAAASSAAAAADLESTIGESASDLAAETQQDTTATTATTTATTSSAIPEVALTKKVMAATTASSKDKIKLPIVPVSAFVVAAGGGGYAFKLYREKAAEEEEERQRRVRLLFGDEADEVEDYGDIEPDGASTKESSSVMDKIDASTSGWKKAQAKKSAPVVEQQPPAAAPAPKKKRLGFFARKKNGRETDLTALVSGPDAAAPEFATVLAKILTFGAPGRFPNVVSLKGGEMPMSEFELEAAMTILSQARNAAGLEMKDSAEVFADVVNCMLIDIVDLASSSLKEDDKTTIDAINIVVDFMQHAASIYDSVAEGIVISPVTYGGDLSKSKLEQMFATYAGGAMMMNGDNVKDDFDSRVNLLQDVFQISEKKAEGLMMKSMQKQMMEMLKSGEGMEGMEQMMAGMGGIPGMEGLAGGGVPGAGGEEPSPEQVKEMLLSLKAMKDSGSFSDEELNTIKKEFKNSFGSSIDDLTSTGETLDATEQELLDLMKAILD